MAMPTLTGSALKTICPQTPMVGGHNNVYPYKLQFNYIKVGLKGVKIIKACFFVMPARIPSQVIRVLLSSDIIVVSAVAIVRIRYTFNNNCCPCTRVV